jgi:hypothetical protein
VGVALLLPAVAAGAAPPPVGLGTAGSFAVLAGSGITNTGSTTVTGDVGTSPTPTETGFGAMTIIGTDHAGGPVTQQAKTDLTAAYDEAAGATPPTSVATELGETTLTPGVYNGATLAITGTLTLDTGGDPSAVFILQSASTLITASASRVVVLNGLQACNVYWQVGSSATLGTGSALIGTVLATTSITATTAATVQGRLLALNGAVTLDTNTITNAGCAAAPVTTTTAAPTTTTTAAPATTTTTTTAGSGGGATSTTAPATPSGPPAPDVPDTPGPTAPTTTSATTTTTRTTTTTGTGRPPLPFTGSDPRLPLAGVLGVTVGVVLLGLSRRTARIR